MMGTHHLILILPKITISTKLKQQQNERYAIKQVFNGDHVIKFTDRKTVQSIQGYQDLSSMGAWYQEDPNKHHLG
jgi:hypothetical protein